MERLIAMVLYGIGIWVLIGLKNKQFETIEGLCHKDILCFGLVISLRPDWFSCAASIVGMVDIALITIAGSLVKFVLAVGIPLQKHNQLSNFVGCLALIIPAIWGSSNLLISWVFLNSALSGSTQRNSAFLVFMEVPTLSPKRCSSLLRRYFNSLRTSLPSNFFRKIAKNCIPVTDGCSFLYPA